MATAEAQVEPALLRWARESLGYTVDAAAEKIGKPPERLASWERGDERPTVAQLRTLATTYKRPLAVFFLAEPPSDFQAIEDFRRLPEAEAGEFGPALRGAILDAQDLRESAVELAEMLDEEVPPWTIEATPKDSERLGEELRAFLGVSLEEQVSWPDPESALRTWVRATEEAGALVSQVQRIPVDEMRGFSISADMMPILVLNGGDAPRGKIFTLFHELAHLALRSSGVCDLHSARRPRSSADRLEIFCNRAAAAALLPRDEFGRHPVVQSPPADGAWADAALAELGERFSVSQEVVLRRLLTLELTTWDYYLFKREEYAEVYRARREQEREERKGLEPPPIYYPLKVRDLGRRYVDLALDAYRNSIISTVEAADYLDVKAANLPGLEREISRRSGGA